MWITFLISVAAALAVSALCSLCEGTLLSLTPGQVEELAKKSPQKAQQWRIFKQDIEKPISIILTVNTAAHTIGATVAGAQVGKIFNNSSTALTVFSIIFTFLMLQFTEILPKTLGVRYNRRIALWVTRPLLFLIVLFKPVVWLIHLINSPFESKSVPGGDGENKRPTLDEITALTGLASVMREIDKNQERILLETTRLNERLASEVMIPVRQIAFLSAGQSLTEAFLQAHHELHTRFPVLQCNNVNEVVGFVNFKELIIAQQIDTSEKILKDENFQKDGKFQNDEKTLSDIKIVNDKKVLSDTKIVNDIVRNVHFVRPNDSLTDVLKIFVNHSAHMAIVRSENGETLGLITLEDLVEELVGELEDELDELPSTVEFCPDGGFFVGGGISFDTLKKELTAKFAVPDSSFASVAIFQEVPSEQKTLSDWFISTLTRTPIKGDSLGIHGWTFTACRVRRRNVFLMKVNPPSFPTTNSSSIQPSTQSSIQLVISSTLKTSDEKPSSPQNTSEILNNSDSLNLSSKSVAPSNPEQINNSDN